MRETAWEYTGRTVGEATQTALEELGLERDDIHVEVLEEAQKGFLGLGGKEARIRVELIGEWEVLRTRQEEQPSEAPGATLDEEEEEEERQITPPGESRQLEATEKPFKMSREILDIMGIDAMVEARERDDSIIVDIWGDDVAILIGRAGTTLDALQYLINVSCRRTGEVTKRIIVDAEGYRKRRKAKLEKQAEQLSSKAVSQNKSIEMQPMNASERKIIHMALRNIQGVWTESLGEGAERHIIIHPDTKNS